MIRKFNRRNKIMHVTKVAQLFPKSMHFAFELAEVYISYSGEYSRLVQGTKCTTLTWSIQDILLRFR